MAPPTRIRHNQAMPESDARPTNAPEITVSELANALKRAIEDRFGYVRVRGEISGYRGPHSSGHAYFSLKDTNARLDAVIWRTTMQRMRLKPEEGLEVIATGRLTTFPKSSKYQIVIEQLQPAGAGALMVLLEERRKKLAAEGLFAKERKRALKVYGARRPADSRASRAMPSMRPRRSRPRTIWFECSGEPRWRSMRCRTAFPRSTFRPPLDCSRSSCCSW